MYRTLKIFVFFIITILLISCFTTKEFKIGDQALQEGNYDVASENLKRAYDKSPDNVDYVTKYAQALHYKCAENLVFVKNGIKKVDTMKLVKEIKSVLEEIKNEA